MQILHVPETEEEDTHDGLPNVSRKIISNSLHIVFGILKKINSKSLTKEITLYLSGAVYNAFRMLYTANPKNPSALFETKDGLSEALTDGRMQLARAKSRVMLLGEKVSDDEAVKKDDLPQLSGEMLSAEYPDCKDRKYMEWLKAFWSRKGFGPFYTSDGAGEHFLKGVVLPGVAVGLDPGLTVFMHHCI